MSINEVIVSGWGLDAGKAYLTVPSCTDLRCLFRPFLVLCHVTLCATAKGINYIQI